MRRGQIWWAGVGDPAGSVPGYRRPAVIVSANRFNDSGINTVVVVFLTTSAARARDPGVVRIGAREGGLPKTSFANVSQIYTVDRRLLQHQAGSVPDALMSRIDDGLRLVLAL